MKKVLLSFLYVFLIFGFITPAFAKEMNLDSEKPIFNMFNQKQLPRGFRTASYKFSPEIVKRKGFSPNAFGLSSIRMSGSSQFSKDSLETIINTVDDNRENVFVVDLRQEVHGFVNKHAISWYAKRNWGNVGMHPNEIEREQQYKLLDLFSQGIASFFMDKKSDVVETLQIDLVESEEKIAQDLGSNYQRFYVIDHTRPSDETVDEFIAFVKYLPKNAWLHFHCKGGKGRTTTFMSMYDMMFNANQVSFEDIVLRQWFIGGINLFTDEMDESWKVEYAVERINFLREFYDYCKENAFFTKDWSTWKKAKTV